MSKPRKKPAFRILIVDDHPIVRFGLVQLLKSQADLEVCAETDSVMEVLEKLDATRPDLAVVDLSLKDGSGLELIKRMKAWNPSVLILVASVHDEVLYAERALRAGASGYVTKAEMPEAIMQAIRTVLEGRVYLSPRMADRFLSRMVNKEDEVVASPMASLSDRELEVFELIGRGLTTRQIAQHLHLSIKTVETYREHIKNKLDLKNAAQLIRHAVEWVRDQS